MAAAHPDHLMNMLRQFRAAMVQYDHHAVNAAARIVGEQIAYRARCYDCAFICEFTGTYGEGRTRLDDALYYYSEATGAQCPRPRQAPPKGWTAILSAAGQQAARMGFLLLDLANSTATILYPTRASYLGKADWQKVLNGMEAIKRELEQAGFTVTIEYRA